MQQLIKSICILTGFLFCTIYPAMVRAQQKPNIIYILADDLGYGDLSCLNAGSKIKTVNVDALSKQGMSFTDAHSNSAVCTPTRYGVLTGRYAWRTRLQNGVLWGYDSMLINNNRTTVASYLKRNGYNTACIGKWHLGLDWRKDRTGKTDLSKPVAAGPRQAGFDYFYGIPASLDMAPYVYIENNRVTATSIDSVSANSDKAFWRSGPAGNDFRHEEVLPTLISKAVNYIHREVPTGNPFFLYLPLTSPHTPILPAQYKGRSGTNEYGDFVLMTDDMVGRIMQAVKDAGAEENTFIIFTSDNGASPMSDFKELAAAGHYPGYVFRGAKADIYEGGHRIPFIAKWPSRVKPGTRSDETICLTDLLATVAEIVGSPLREDEGEDSFSILPLLTGNKTYLRTSIIHHSIDGKFSIRDKHWKLILASGSGGWSTPTEKEAIAQGLSPVQLYDLSSDIGETNNMATDHPSVVRSLSALLESIVENGRSTPGAKQRNDARVVFK